MSGLHTITSSRLSLTVSELGAEMQSLRLDGRELLWQGEAPYWRDRAIHLFPYIARLTGGTYTYRGKPFRMDIHGFLKDSRLSLCREEDGVLSFVLSSSADTLSQYPFPFRCTVTYQLEDCRVSVGYRVENLGGEAIYFGVGGHPGFRVPLDEGLAFDDYYLEFSRPCQPQRVLFSPENFVTGQAPFELEDSQRLPLAHALFDQDAVVLADTSGSVTLESHKGATGLSMDYWGFPYIGLWHNPRTDAPFVCIEPWSSLPSRQGVTEELTEQQDLIRLEKGEVYVNEWTIRPHG